MKDNQKKLYYHYCSIDTFVKIIENSTIRVSNPYKMNDTQEYKWLLNFIPEVVEDYLAKVTNVNEVEKYKEFYINTCKEIFDDFYSEKEHPYIACFSKDGDMLSQWRSYADNSRGVAIGFCLEELTRHCSLEVIDVNYNLHEQKSLLLNILIESGLEDPENLNFHRIKHMFVAATIVLDNILDKSICCKNPAFMEEREARLVYRPETFVPNNETSSLVLSDIQFRNDNEKLISYYDIDFSKIKTDVIKEIYIGSNSKLNDRDLILFLEKNGYSPPYDLKIIPSVSTYR